MTEKIILGIIKKGSGTHADGEVVMLEKHKWTCNWYWSFGWIGNARCHFHFDSLLKDSRYASELFKETKISDKQWWLMRDLFKQAYALRAAAETYQYGGHQCHEVGVTDVIYDSLRADMINKDVKKLLDAVWDIACNAVNGSDK